MIQTGNPGSQKDNGHNSLYWLDDDVSVSGAVSGSTAGQAAGEHGDSVNAPYSAPGAPTFSFVNTRHSLPTDATSICFLFHFSGRHPFEREQTQRRFTWGKLANFVESGSPRQPSRLLPQVYSSPSVVTQQLCPYPADTFEQNGVTQYRRR